MATSVGDIALNLNLDKKPYEKGLADVKNSAGRIGSGIGKSLAVGIASALGAVVATAGLNSLISQASQLGDTIDKMSQKMGMNSQAYQEWGYIMERCGTSIDSMSVSMKTLASSAETSKDAFAELGITEAEIASLSQEELFSRTITALQNVEDTTKRTYLAGQLLGRGATELGAVLNMSASETEALRQNLTTLGGVMSQQAVANSAEYQDALTDIKMAFRSVSNTVAEYVLPIITSAINSYIIPAIQKACAVIRYFASLWNSVFGAIGKGASFIGKAFGKISSGFKSTFGKAQQKQNAKMAKSLGGVSKGVGGTGKSAKKAKKAVKELTRELMGFDKMNKLAKKNNASGAGGGAGGGGGGGAGGIGGLDDAIGGVDKKLFDMSKITQKLAPLWKALGDIFKAVLRLIKALGKAFAPVGKWILEHLIKPFGKLIGMAIIAVLQGIAGAIELLAKFVERHPKLVVILTGVATALFMITHKGAGAPRLFTALGKAFGIVGKAIMAHPIVAIIVGIALAIGYIYKNWNKIKKTKFGKVLIAIGNALKPVGEMLKKIAIYIGGKFIKAFKTAVALVKGFKEAWTGIKSKAVELKAKVGEVAGDIWEGITDTTATITIGLVNNFSSAWNAVKDTWNGIKSRAEAITTKLTDYFASAWNGVKGAWAGIKSRTESVTTKLVDYFSKAWGGIKNAWNGIKSKTATLTVDIKAKLAKGWNGIVDKLRKSGIKTISNFGKKLPKFAQGGWVAKNSPQLAIVGDNRHESEIVAPDSKLMAMARQASQEAVKNSSNAQVVNLLAQLLVAVQGLDTNVYLDGQDITRNTIKNINQQTRTTGKFPLVV